MTSPPRSPWPRLVGVGLVLAAGAGAYALWGGDPPPAPAGRPTAAVDLLAEPDDLPGADYPPNPGYLGMQACADCHADRVAVVRGSPHARACRPHTDGPMPPGFLDPARGTHKPLEPGLTFRMSMDGPGPLITAEQEMPAGVRRTHTRLDLVYGAHKADEVFFFWKDDGLYESMISWLHPFDRWGNTSFDRHGVGDFARQTTPRCLECHTTWAGHLPGSVNRYDRAGMVLGVTCEKCHGPGRDHVAHHRANPADQEPHAVVRPALLARERQIEVCTQCHGNSVKPYGPAFTYRPGEVLAEHFRTAVTHHPEEDHVANQIKYLRQSKCFQKSEMTCVSCHDPHRPHEPGDPAGASAGCAQCHQPEACKDRPRLPEGVRNDCVGCHMPPRVWMNVHFHTSDERYVPPIRRYEHRVGVHPEARQDLLLRWHRSQPGDDHKREADRLATALADHWLKESDARRGAYRFLAAIGAAREAVRVDPPAAVGTRARDALKRAIATQAELDGGLADAFKLANDRQYPAAVGAMRGLLARKPNWGAVHSKLGTVYAASGQTDRAVEHLAAVAVHDGDDGSGLAMLGWLAYLGGRPAEAVEHYRKAIDIEPRDAKVLSHWGLALLRLDRPGEAADRFRLAIAIDPQHAGAYHGLSHAVRGGDPPAAARYALRAARLTRWAEADVLVTLADAYAAAGRPAHAAAAADKALEAGLTDPALRMRMSGLKARR